MSDFISRQAAIDRLETIGYDFSDSGLSATELAEVCEAVGDVRQDMIRMIKRLPSAQPEQRWIPCSERLPEEDFWSGRGRQFSDHVLVTIVNRGNDDERFTDIAQTVDGIWQLSHDVDGDCSLPNWCEVIAWMPLPKQYKGEES